MSRLFHGGRILRLFNARGHYHSTDLLSFTSKDGVMAFVLCTGADPVVMRTRTMILERAGHEVVTATGERELMDACSKVKFDVAVIGQAISPIEKQRVMRLVRQHCPATKVLELFVPSQGKALLDADDWLEAPMTPPADLVDRVATLAGKSSGASSN